MMESTELVALRSDLARCVEELERERSARRAAEGLAEEVSLAHATVLDGLDAAKEEILAARHEIVRLSHLVLPIWPSVLLMPVIGRLDVERADLVCQTLVEEAARRRARVIILDVSGVPAADQDFAYTLRRFDETLHMIGSQLVLCGVRPELASLAVTGEQDSAAAVLRMPIRRTLSEALRWAIRATRA